jgi:hypothetical protein
MQTKSTSGAAASLLKIGDLHRGRQRPTVRVWALEEALEHPAAATKYSHR